MANPNLAMRIILRLQDDASRGLDTARGHVRGIGQEVDRVKQLMVGFFSFVAIKQGLESLTGLSNKYASLTGRIKQAIGSTGDLAATHQKLFDIAQRTNTPLEETVQLYARGAQALKKFSNGQGIAAKLAETVGLSFKAQSSSAAEVTSTITQLTQAISTDTVQWEDFGQLADTNLMLVNVAAKNLGYDGLGSLKKAMADGKVGNAELVNAIVGGFDEIKAAADNMPLTVAASWTKLENRLLVFVGQSKGASDATHAIASGIGFITDHLDQFVALAIKAGEVALAMFAASKVNALLNYTQGLIASAAAARADAAAAELNRIQTLALLEAKAAAARAGVTAQRAMLEEARLGVALAATTNERTLATARLTAELNRLGIAQGRASTATANLAAAQDVAAVSTTRLSRAFAALGGLGGMVNGLFGAWIAWDIGTTIGNWGLQFDWVQKVGANIAQMTAKFVAFGAFMTTPLSLASWQTFAAELDNIDVHFDGVRASIGKTTQAHADGAASMAQTEAEKSALIAAEALKQQTAFASVQTAAKALSDSISAEAKAQTAAIEQALIERLALIDAMDISEAAKDTLRVTAKLAASTAEVTLQQNTAEQKLAVIDQEYAAELTLAATNAQRSGEIESQKRRDKLAVYTGLADYYQGEVNRLSGVYASELQLAQQAKQQLENLNQTHEQALFNIKLMGMGEREKIDAQESLFNDKLRKIKTERAKGEQADQDKINALLGDARGLHDQITSAAGNGSDALAKAKGRENILWAQEKTTLEANATAHEKNAERAKAAHNGVNEQLQATQTTIKDITDKLNAEYALKIGIDTASLTAAQSIIARLVAPETKTIYINTVETSGPAAQATGGPAGQPTGEPWRFAAGGFLPRTGKLPGFGGGDKIKALLESGEFIVRKEAVKKLGMPFMHLVNAGQQPVGDVIRRATGGPVDASQIRRDGAASARTAHRRQQLDDLGSALLDIAQGAGMLADRSHYNGYAIGSGAANKLDTTVLAGLNARMRKAFSDAEVGSGSDDGMAIIREAGDDYQKNGAAATLSATKERIRRLIEDLTIADAQALESSQTISHQADSRAVAVEREPSAAKKRVAALPTLPEPKTFSVPQPVLPAKASSGNGQAQAQGSSTTVKVQFVSPTGSQSAGRFNPSDASAILQVLKDSGARTV
ncbi:tape measure protein [Methylobacter sp. G7]|uniref:tape measure protein n=1 Tax=Methylobacter sp. G7 TaxID=3230117 RepID=UPI003D809ADC